MIVEDNEYFTRAIQDCHLHEIKDGLL